jgi:hypothetical protein
MANEMIKAEHVADAAELALHREIVLPALTWTDLGREDFVGAKNDTVTLRLPGSAVATVRDLRSTADVVFSELEEIPVDVTLSKDVSVDLSATLAELTLDIVPFAKRFVDPAIIGQAEGVESVIGTALDGATPADTVTWDGSASGVKAALIGASKKFQLLNVPRRGRSCVVGANAYGEFLDYASSIPNFVGNGTADTAILEATIARLFGFNVVTSNAIDPDAVFAMAPYAIAFVAFGPDIPNGAIDGAHGSTNGIGYSVIFDYDATKRKDRMSIQSYVGATSVEFEVDGETVNPFLLRIGDFS